MKRSQVDSGILATRRLQIGSVCALYLLREPNLVGQYAIDIKCLCHASN